MFLLRFAAPYPGNFLLSFKTHEAKLNTLGYRAIYVFPDKAKQFEWIDELRAEGRQIEFYPFADDSPMQIFSTLQRLIKKHQVGLIHANFWDPKQFIYFQLLKILTPGLKVIHHHHYHYSFTEGETFLKAMKRFAVRCSGYMDTHIGVSEFIASNLRTIGYPQQRVYAVPNAIVYSRLDHFQTDIRKEIGVNEDQRIVLLFGYDFHGKGVDVTIDALRDIAISQKIVLVLCVAANLDQFLDNIKKHIGTIPDWIRIVPPREDVASYYRSADVFLSASREEGFCYSLPEAAYSECMLVASDIPGQNLKIPGTINYPVESAMELQKSILSALARSKLDKENVIQQQIEYVTTKFHIDRWSDQVIEVYQHCLSRK